MAEKTEISDGRKTPETRKRISERQRGSGNSFHGKTHSAEFCAAQSQRTKAFNANRTYDIEPRSTRDLTDTEVAYLAGIVDGEGSIVFPSKSLRTFKICVYNTNERLMKWLVEINGRKPTKRQPRGNGLVTARVPIYLWEVTKARDIFYLLTAMGPHLKIKQEKCVRAIGMLIAKYGDRIRG